MIDVVEGRRIWYKDEECNIIGLTCGGQHARCGRDTMTTNVSVFSVTAAVSQRILKLSRASISQDANGRAMS